MAIASSGLVHCVLVGAVLTAALSVSANSVEEMEVQVKAMEKMLMDLKDKVTKMEWGDKADRAKILKQEQTIGSLVDQLQAQQQAEEERARSDGNSGIKQIRGFDQGTKHYHHNSVVGSAPLTIHDHSNYDSTVGMGEIIAVLNGVEFRTRHNDYTINQPVRRSAFKSIDRIKFPDTPPEVLSKKTVAEQTEEMRAWFKAWQDQDYSVRDYRKYFKPVMCYLEGAWTLPVAPLDEKIEESFKSYRHSLDATSFGDMAEKIRFMSAGGRKDELENYAFLPRKVYRMRNGVVEFAQWNYRILCHPISFDVPLKLLKPVDDLPTRMKHMYTYDKLAQSRKARFDLLPNARAVNKELKTDFRSTVDRVMAEIPGMQNYGAVIWDNVTDHLLLKSSFSSERRTLNANYYHRWYTSRGEQSLSFSVRRRGFSDDNLYVSLNRQARVMPESMTACFRSSTLKKKVCERYTQRASYAIPLEIIYLNPLLTWNPYNVSIKSRSDRTVAVQDGRTGSCLKKGKAYNGVHGGLYYITPSEFFSGGPIEKDAADTTRAWVCVEDQKGVPRKMAASGTRVIMPNIPGVGALRQRYPVFPVHQEGSHTYKEVEALKEIVMEPERYGALYRHDPLISGGRANTTYQVDNSKMFTLRGGASHVHTLDLDSDDLDLLRQGETVSKVTTETAGHTHLAKVKMTVDKNGKEKFTLFGCDSGTKCFDGHSDLVPAET